MSERAVVLFSGGMDSTTLAYKVCHEYRNRQKPLLLSIIYGQRHKIEIDCAANISMELGCEHRIFELPHFELLCPKSALLGGADIPHGHYEHESMKATVVPNRNMILISLAAAAAIDIGAREIYYAAHAGDHAIYPDCRQDFVSKLAATLEVAHYERLVLRAPFLFLKKCDIILFGKELNVPFDKTWSCYEGDYLHCGKCGTCVERKEAFQIAGMNDPTQYKA